MFFNILKSNFYSLLKLLTKSAKHLTNNLVVTNIDVLIYFNGNDMFGNNKIISKVIGSTLGKISPKYRTFGDFI